MNIIVKRGERGRWRWTVRDDEGNAKFLSSVSGFGNSDAAKQDALHCLTETAIAFRPVRWWETWIGARDRARDRINACLEFEA